MISLEQNSLINLESIGENRIGLNEAITQINNLISVFYMVADEQPLDRNNFPELPYFNKQDDDDTLN